MHSVTKQTPYPVRGAGLGLRRGLMAPLQSVPSDAIDFMEVAPENWIGVGGRWGRKFRAYTERFPFVCHGLSLSIGGPAELDEAFVHRVKRFLDEHQIRCYSEHLSYCSDDGHLYDLMPIPFTEEAIHHVVDRVNRVQDILGRRIALENVSYYAAPGQQMPEIEFVNAVIDQADCDLLLDVNNIYVNSINHQYDAHTYLEALPLAKVAYCHIAGHTDEDVDLIVDTHGADVIDPVWALLKRAYELAGPMPTLLERDFNFPKTDALLGEVSRIREYQQTARQHSTANIKQTGTR